MADEKKSWWLTLPALLTGIAALIGAIVSLIAVLNNVKTKDPVSYVPPPVIKNEKVIYPDAHLEISDDERAQFSIAFDEIVDAVVNHPEKLKGPIVKTVLGEKHSSLITLPQTTDNTFSDAHSYDGFHAGLYKGLDSSMASQKFKKYQQLIESVNVADRRVSQSKYDHIITSSISYSYKHSFILLSKNVNDESQSSGVTLYIKKTDY